MLCGVKMKKVYNTILCILKDLPLWLELLKYNIFERIKIIKDRKCYTKQILSEDDILRIDQYWKAHYGKRICKAWHRYYMSFSGNLDEKYFPQIIYSTKLEHRLNPWYYTLVLHDKNLLNTLFGDTVRCPFVYGKKCGNNYFDADGAPVAYSDFVKKLTNIGKVVIKPTTGSSSGSGIRICIINDGIDALTGQPIEVILNFYKTDYNIQEYIKQSKVLSKINPDSINTFRVITYIANNRINIAPIAMRFGRKGSCVDNIHAGGLSIGVNEDGRLKKYAFLEFGERFERHPDTNVVFEDYYIPSIDKVMETSVMLHKKLPCLGMISWDFTLGENDEVVLLEVNLKGQSVWFLQEVHGKGLFGENTEYMLQIMKR